MNMDKIWKLTVEKYERMDDLYSRLIDIKKECKYQLIDTDGLDKTIEKVEEQIETIKGHALGIILGADI